MRPKTLNKRKRKLGQEKRNGVKLSKKRKTAAQMKTLMIQVMKNRVTTKKETIQVSTKQIISMLVVLELLI